MQDPSSSAGFIAHIRGGLRFRSFYQAAFALGSMLFFAALVAGAGHELALRARVPGISLNHLAEAEELFARGDFEAAVNAYRTATAIAPDDYQARLRYGVAALSAGRVDEAVAQFEEVLRRTPLDASAHYMLGAIALEYGRLEEAARHTRLAILARADFAQAYSNLGAVLRMQGDQAAAVENYQRALHIDPTLASARNGLRSLGQDAP